MADENQIDEAFKNEYADNLEDLTNTPEGSAEEVFSVEKFDGKAKFVDQMGGVRLRKKGARNEELPLVDPAVRRRKLTMSTHHAATLMDQDDSLQMLLDPTSSYLRAYSDACKVTKWKVGIEGAIGDAWQGEEDPIKVPLPEDNILKHGDAGMTFSKLRAARKILRTKGGLMWKEKPIVLWTGHQEDELLNDDFVKSHDYNNEKVMVDGELRYWYGCNFRLVDDYMDLVAETLEPILPKVDVTRSVIMLAKSGVVLGTPKSGRNTEGRIDWIGRNQSNQVSAAVRCGSTRRNDYSVVVIECKETP